MERMNFILASGGIVILAFLALMFWVFHEPKLEPERKNPFPMNKPALLFRNLLNAHSVAPHSAASDATAKSLLAELLRANDTYNVSTCVGLFNNDFSTRMYFVKWMLENWGIEVRVRQRRQKDGFFVFLELAKDDT